MEGGKGVRIGRPSEGVVFSQLIRCSLACSPPPLFLLLPSFLLSLLLLSIVRNHRFFFSLFFFSLTSCFPLDDGTRLYNVYIYAFLIFNFFDSRSIVQPSIRLQASFSFDIIIFPLLHSHPPLLPPPYPIILIVIFSSWKKKNAKTRTQ